MGNEIILQKNNDGRDWSDLEWVEEFYEFLQGDVPSSVRLKEKLNLSPEQAFNVIWYLQEQLPVFPDHIQRCGECDSLYDPRESGFCDENNSCYCNNCAH